MVLVGGGEHARVVAEAIRSRPELLLIGFVDPQPCRDMAERLGIPRLGGDEWVGARPEVRLVLGVGAVEPSAARPQLVEKLGSDPEQWATVVHERAWVSPTAALAEGVVVMAGAIVNSGARIGPHAVINTAAVVEHDTVVHEYAQLGPGTIVGGGSTIAARCYVGLGARVRDHISVGKGSLIGMGAVVVRDVPAGVRVVGVPAKEMRGKGDVR